MGHVKAFKTCFGLTSQELGAGSTRSCSACCLRTSNTATIRILLKGDILGRFSAGHVIKNPRIVSAAAPHVSGEQTTVLKK